ncbi:flavin-containing monooxygenase [Citromicrobium sp. JLT1363]|uniref:flavin-containing monooxygenase n=1 Tax=Citromicrobium sp. JLT1363 TaxID=517722 RepID=UPI000225EB41|nr:NAD(P)/FAD-dependent oxidoreductase [Citromicrobium sp. JLT1363]
MRSTTPSDDQEVDVLVVGAGISGIDVAYHLKKRCPDRSFIIAEARERIGGTWDLFRYPGIRSDSDMHTLGLPFRPWRGENAIVDGPAIRDYLEDTAREFGIDRHIRFGLRVVSADWDGAACRWIVTVDAAGEESTIRARYLYWGSGYYSYSEAHAPQLAGVEDFAGQIIHPQFWPEDQQVEGKTIVVIGSGATAITLVPALAARGARVVMLQRSPTYVVSRDPKDRIANRLHRLLPGPVADRLVRWKNVAYGMATYGLARKRPEKVRQAILKGVGERISDARLVERHFTPDYDPWDQRICLVPDGDLFDAIERGSAQVVTGKIDRFESNGIRLRSGRLIECDIAVTATGLKMELFGGARLTVDGRPFDMTQRTLYRGMLISGLPNMALAFGYVNASWTLKCDLTARNFCRLLNESARRNDAAFLVPQGAPHGHRKPMIALDAGYVKRAADILPMQGSHGGWQVRTNVARDTMDYHFSPIEKSEVEFRDCAGAKVEASR